VIDVDTYLHLLPKAELHCHFVSVMRPETMVRLARKNGVRLKTENVVDLLDFDNLADFLDVFNAAHAVLVDPEDFATVAYEGVEDGIRDGNLAYREYFINPFNFTMPYGELVDAIAAGLQRAERDFGVGFRLIAAINRSHSAERAVELVETVLANPRHFVVGIGQDDLTPELTEDPTRFAAAYELAGVHGLRRSAHAGETMTASAQNVVDAIEVLGVDRVDHGYRVVDDASALAVAKASGVAFTCTPVSTRVLSGWAFDADHRIARMVRAGLPVSFATDDAVFFQTDIGTEYREAIVAMGLSPAQARQIARAGFEAAWCSPDERSALLARFDATALVLDGLLDH
jgi:adenosine deaminase